MDVPDYDLPESAIAQVPAARRDAARLLVALDQTVRHLRVAALADLLEPGDLLVVNTSRVVPARLALQKQSGGAAEVLLLEPVPGRPGRFQALVRPGRRLPPGTVLYSGAQAVVEVGERLSDGSREVQGLVDDLAPFGALALPPYIHHPLEDPERYQTVYAERPGSVAAPTAGLHLAVGLGTFRPIKAARVEEHAMHSERYSIARSTWEACQGARRVVAVGTTTLRALESAAASGILEGRTELFIRPGYPFRVVDVLLTNFHQPRSTLLVLLQAFAGPRWRELYAVALEEGYRFLSFGDAMIVARDRGPLRDGQD